MDKPDAVPQGLPNREMSQLELDLRPKIITLPIYSVHDQRVIVDKVQPIAWSNTGDKNQFRCFEIKPPLSRILDQSQMNSFNWIQYPKIMYQADGLGLSGETTLQGLYSMQGPDMRTQHLVNQRVIQYFSHLPTSRVHTVPCLVHPTFVPDYSQIHSSEFARMSFQDQCETRSKFNELLQRTAESELAKRNDFRGRDIFGSGDYSIKTEIFDKLGQKNHFFEATKQQDMNNKDKFLHLLPFNALVLGVCHDIESAINIANPALNDMTEFCKAIQNFMVAPINQVLHKSMLLKEMILSFIHISSAYVHLSSLMAMQDQPFHIQNEMNSLKMIYTRWEEISSMLILNLKIIINIVAPDLRTDTRKPADFNTDFGTPFEMPLPTSQFAQQNLLKPTDVLFSQPSAFTTIPNNFSHEFNFNNQDTTRLNFLYKQNTKQDLPLNQLYDLKKKCQPMGETSKNNSFQPFSSFVSASKGNSNFRSKFSLPSVQSQNYTNFSILNQKKDNPLGMTKEVKTNVPVKSFQFNLKLTNPQDEGDDINCIQTLLNDMCTQVSCADGKKLKEKGNSDRITKILSVAHSSLQKATTERHTQPTVVKNKLQSPEEVVKVKLNHDSYLPYMFYETLSSETQSSDSTCSDIPCEDNFTYVPEKPLSNDEDITPNKTYYTFSKADLTVSLDKLPEIIKLQFKHKMLDTIGCIQSLNLSSKITSLKDKEIIEKTVMEGLNKISIMVYSDEYRCVTDFVNDTKKLFNKTREDYADDSNIIKLTDSLEADFSTVFSKEFDCSPKSLSD